VDTNGPFPREQLPVAGDDLPTRRRAQSNHNGHSTYFISNYMNFMKHYEVS
jgi:hypothetical protein